MIENKKTEKKEKEQVNEGAVFYEQQLRLACGEFLGKLSQLACIVSAKQDMVLKDAETILDSVLVETKEENKE